MPHLSQKRNAGNQVAATSSDPRSAWQLPSGQTLGEFALRSGILAPQLLLSQRKVTDSQAAIPFETSMNIGGRR